MNNQSIKISENCWKHNYNGCFLYRKESDPESDFHREHGPAIEYSSGNKHWYINNKRHREDGPAIEKSNGYKEWYINGKLHREGGPAIEYANGKKYWYYHGVLIYVSSQEEFEKHIDIKFIMKYFCLKE